MMQLKITRSQRESGVVSKSAIFCLDARVEFTPEERQSVTRYKLQNQVIYNSEDAKRLLDKSDSQRDGSMAGGLKSLATLAFAAMKLNITIGGLERGQHIECKSLDELLGAEDAIMTACQNLKSYLDTALTFDGREVLIEYTTGAEPAVIAHATTPSPMLVAPAMGNPPAAVEYQPAQTLSYASDASAPDGPQSRLAESLGVTDAELPKVLGYSAAAAFVFICIFVLLGQLK